MSDPARVEIKDSVMEVTIDRPKANAINAATSRRLGEVFAQFRDDPALRVAIVTGAGEKFFSAGWDLKAAARGEETDEDHGPSSDTTARSRLGMALANDASSALPAP